MVEFVHQLSRVAARVYLYLRTWLIGEPGRGSGWRELRVSKIAQDLGWSSRHVRRGLAELQAQKLIARKEQHVTLDDGTHPQVPNLWRILPEPGYPLAEHPADDSERPDEGEGQDEEPEETPEAPPTGPDVDTLDADSIGHDHLPSPDTLLERALLQEAAGILEALPQWLEDEILEAHVQVADAENEAVLLEKSAPHNHPDQDVRMREAARELRESCEAMRAKVEQLRALRGLDRVALARHPVWWNGVLSTLGNRVARLLLSHRWRRRKVERQLTGAFLAQWMDGYLQRVGDP